MDWLHAVEQPSNMEGEREKETEKIINIQPVSREVEEISTVTQTNKQTTVAADTFEELRQTLLNLLVSVGLNCSFASLWGFVISTTFL